MLTANTLPDNPDGFTAVLRPAVNASTKYTRKEEEMLQSRRLFATTATSKLIMLQPISLIIFTSLR